jgi:hypothetical protein
MNWLIHFVAGSVICISIFIAASLAYRFLNFIF